MKTAFADSGSAGLLSMPILLFFWNLSDFLVTMILCFLDKYRTVSFVNKIIPPLSQRAQDVLT